MTEIAFYQEFNNIHNSLLRYGLNSWNIEDTQRNLMSLFKQYQEANKPAELASFPASTEEKEDEKSEVKEQ